MAVKHIRSASRVLDILEAIARNQPVGISALARLVDTDKSAVQRAVLTLASEEWIQRVPGMAAEWRLTSRLHAMSHAALGRTGLRELVAPVLQALRDASGETAALTLLDHDQLVIADVAESRHLLRMATQAGLIAPLPDGASARAILAWWPLERVESLLGGRPDTARLEDFKRTRARGYAVSEGPPAIGAVTVGAPIFEPDGLPLAAILVIAPRERLPPERYAEVGALVLQAARSVSRGLPASSAPALSPNAGTAKQEDAQDHGTD